MTLSCSISSKSHPRVSLFLVDSVETSNGDVVWFVFFFVDVLLQTRACNHHESPFHKAFYSREFDSFDYYCQFCCDDEIWLCLFQIDRGVVVLAATKGLWRRWWTEAHVFCLSNPMTQLAKLSLPCFNSSITKVIALLCLIVWCVKGSFFVLILKFE